MCILPSCISVQCVCAWYLKRIEGALNSLKLEFWVLGIEPGASAKQQMFLTAWLSSQPQSFLSALKAAVG